MFGDDLKFFKVMKSMDYCYTLQKDLDRFMKWCKENGLKVNASKCKQISFYHTRNSSAKRYVIENEELEFVKNIKDLGLILSSNLTFNNHIESLCSKTFRNLGFIKRNCNEFKNPDCLTTL